MWLGDCVDVDTPIDVTGLAAVHLMSRRAAIEDFKLPTVAEALGLDVDGGKMHDAQYDVELMRQVFGLLRVRA